MCYYQFIIGLIIKFELASIVDRDEKEYCSSQRIKWAYIPKGLKGCRLHR